MIGHKKQPPGLESIGDLEAAHAKKVEQRTKSVICYASATNTYMVNTMNKWTIENGKQMKNWERETREQMERGKQVNSWKREEVTKWTDDTLVVLLIVVVLIAVVVVIVADSGSSQILVSSKLT